MTQWLKQSTAVTVKMGPFLDATDGDTEMTALTISQADIRVTKNGGAFAQTNNATGATHDENGFYGVPLDTTDTATLGTLKVFIHEATALAVWQEFMVVPANVWDSLFGADKLQIDLTQINGAAQTATLDTIKAETASILTDTTEIGAAGAGLTALATQASVNTIDDLLDTEVAAIKTVVDAILVDTAEIGAAGAGLTALATQASVNTIDGIVDAILVDTAEIGAAGAGLTALASAANLAIVAGYLDTEIAAILEDTGTTLPAQISALENLSAAEVNAEVVDALNVDTYAEPTGVPAATASLVAKIGRLHQIARNKIEVTATAKLYYSDADVALWQKALSDDGTTYTEAEATAP